MFAARVVVALSLGATALAGQALPVIKLRPADATLDAQVAGMRAIRELPDGRLLITDTYENRLLVADFRTQEVRSIGRVGSGPGEVRHFGRLYALGGDTTLLTDEPEGRRWVLLAGDRIVATLPPDHPLIDVSSGAPRGADRLGNIVLARTASQKRTPLKMGFRLLDSSHVIVASRANSRLDTMMRALNVDQRVHVGGTKQRPTYIMVPAALSSVDAISMSPDGWVAVASQFPFRVTWRDPSGRLIHGPVIPAPRAPIDANEKRAYQRRFERLGSVAGSVPEEGWADVVAPFGGWFMSLHSPDGKLLLRRLAWSGDEGTNYHVIDRAGRRVAEIRLPESEWLIGFGAKSVYRVSRDEDDFLLIHRHPWH